MALALLQRIKGWRGVSENLQTRTRDDNHAKKLGFLSLYGINGLSFLSNVGAIFVYSHLAGPAGYGIYGIYVAFMSIYLILELSLLKAALLLAEKSKASHTEEQAEAVAVNFLNWSLIPIVIGSVVLGLTRNYLFPLDTETQIGGSMIAWIVVAEHVLSYPANRLSFHLTARRRFASVYVLRLGATLLRHGFAMGVLLISRSIFLAIAAIMLKGVTIGALSFFLTRRHYPVSLRKMERPPFPDFSVLGSFFGAAFALLAIQELPSVYIDHKLGREVLGHYRFLYDLVAAIWFVATIYPTVLFTYLLPKHGKQDPDLTRKKLSAPSDILALLHVTYFFVVCSLLSGAVFFKLHLVDSQMSFAFGVTAAVCLLGYSRFLIEATQALGLGRLALLAISFAACMVAAYFLLIPDHLGGMEIGWGWFTGQVILFILLKLVMIKAVGISKEMIRNALIILLPLIAVVVAQEILPNDYILGVSLLGALIGGLSTIGLAYRFLLHVPKGAQAP